MALVSSPSETDRIIDSIGPVVHSLSRQEFINEARSSSDFRGQCYTFLIEILTKQLNIKTPVDAPAFEKWKMIKKIDATNYSQLVEALYGLGCYAELDPLSAEKLILLAVDDLTDDELNYRDKETRTILQLSTQLKTSVLFDALISTKRVSIEKVDACGRTAAHWCCYNENLQTLRKLIQLGANVDIKDQSGLTVRELTGELNSFQQAVDKTRSRSDYIAQLSPGLKDAIQDELYHGKVSKDQRKEIMQDTPNGTYFFYTPDAVLTRKFSHNSFKLCVKIPKNITIEKNETVEQRVQRNKIGKIKSFTCRFNAKTEKLTINYPSLEKNEFTLIQEIVNTIPECKKPFPFYLNLTNKGYTSLI